MIKAVLILGSTLTFAAFLITALSGIDNADRDGRIPMPGEKALELAAGKYGIYYEEAVNTGENETFEPPEGIRVRVRGLGGAPDPKLDLGGLGSQIGTDNRTAETIGTLEVEEDGRYGVVVGPPPRGGARPTITVGETGSASFIRGAKLAGLIAAITGALVLLMRLGRRVSGRRAESVPTPPVDPWVPSAPAPALPHTPPPAEPPRDNLAELERLAALRKDGAITEEEFQRLKASLLA